MALMMNQKTPPAGDENPWVKIIAKYRNPSLTLSWWQLANTFIPYVLLWGLMVWSLSISYWLTWVFIIPAAGFTIRLFIIFHDCGHGSYFKSQRMSDIIGYFLGVLTFTPYDRWHHAHSIHHRTAGNLDKRGTGDVWTLTVKEYLELPKKQQLYYRIYRNPFIMFGIGAALVFFLGNRFTRKNFTSKERNSVYLTNLGIIILASILCYTIGWKAYLMIQFPVMYVAAVAGVYMFYVQHQFDEVHWSDEKNWDFKEVALQGSSFFKLPKVLQWFTGNIGFHHIHHLSFKIPNYYLEACHKESPVFQSTKPITLFRSFRTLRLRLWNEETRRLVGFRNLKPDYS
jgi:acyl-lipid omega-6 desaturase (Delta-12 desaturase)